jgi:hypothetical protein
VETILVGGIGMLGQQVLGSSFGTGARCGCCRVMSSEHACANDATNSDPAIPSNPADPTETVAEEKGRTQNHWGHVPPIRTPEERRTGIWL